MHENSRCKAVDQPRQEIVSHSQVLRSRRERVCLVLAHHRIFGMGYMGVRHPGFQRCAWPPTRLPSSSLSIARCPYQDGATPAAVLVYRNERLCMRADGRASIDLQARYLNRSSDTLKGIPELLRGHFAQDGLGMSGAYELLRCKDGGPGRECDRLAAT